MLRFSWVPRRARQCENRGRQVRQHWSGGQRSTTARLRAGRAKGRGDHAISMTDGTRSQAWLFWLGLGLSLAIHVGVAAHLLTREPRGFRRDRHHHDGDQRQYRVVRHPGCARAERRATDAAPVCGRRRVSPPPTRNGAGKSRNASAPETEPEKAEPESRRRRQTANNWPPSRRGGGGKGRAAGEKARRRSEDPRSRGAEAGGAWLSARKPRKPSAKSRKPNSTPATKHANSPRSGSTGRTRGRRARGRKGTPGSGERKKTERERAKKSGDQVSSAGASGSRGRKDRHRPRLCQPGGAARTTKASSMPGSRATSRPAPAVAAKLCIFLAISPVR